MKIADILPWRILTDRTLVSAILTTVLAGFTGLLVIVQLPIYVQIVNELTATQSGVRLLPAVIAATIGAAVGGLISMKNNYSFYALIIGTGLLLVGCGMYSITPISFELPHMLYGSQVIGGLGAGMTFCCTTMIISLDAEFRDHALAQGLIAQARVIGGTLGVAASSALFGDHIGELVGVLSREQIEILYRNPGYMSRLDFTQQLAVRTALALSSNESLRICTYLAAVGVAVPLFVWQRNPPSLQQRKAELEQAILAGSASPYSQGDEEKT